jgi:hypothetical protein
MSRIGWQRIQVKNQAGNRLPQQHSCRSFAVDLKFGLPSRGYNERRMKVYRLLALLATAALTGAAADDLTEGQAIESALRKRATTGRHFRNKHGRLITDRCPIG